jgi:hypothetical protein
MIVFNEPLDIHEVPTPIYKTHIQHMPARFPN